LTSPLIDQLIESLCALPGIGPKSAQRITFDLLAKKGQPKGLKLAEILTKTITRITNCTLCQNYTESLPCWLCQNSKRNTSMICVVETPADLLAIEQSNAYSGLYFVLNGHLSPLDGIGPQEIGIPILLNRLKTETIHELILATNLTMEGKATAGYIANQLTPFNIKCTRIAHGVPMGGELEYLDSGTLTHAFHSRITVEK